MPEPMLAVSPTEVVERLIALTEEMVALLCAPDAWERDPVQCQSALTQLLYRREPLLEQTRHWHSLSLANADRLALMDRVRVLEALEKELGDRLMTHKSQLGQQLGQLKAARHQMVGYRSQRPQ